MKIVQNTITTIVAEEGKLLVRKSDGWVAGDTVTLGYNYYEAGVSLSEPHRETPDDYEEIDRPDNYERTPVINHVKRLQRTTELIKKNIREMNELNLSSADALQVVDWYPEWLVDDGVKVGDIVPAGYIFRHQGKLWRVLQEHTIHNHYYPSENTTELYRVVTPHDDVNNEMLYEEM